MSILFATPCYGGMVTEAHFSSCLQLKDSLNSEGIDHNWYTLANESLVQRARNNCAEFFLEETDFEYLMFLDADIEFKPEDVATLYQMEKDVAVGVYRMKKPDSMFAAWVKGKLVTDLDQFTSPVCVDYAGTGFMMIHRSVFERLKKYGDGYPPLHHYENSFGRKEYGFFMCPVENDTLLSEDYYFCKRCGERGIDIWMDPNIKLTHWGTTGYGPAATA